MMKALGEMHNFAIQNNLFGRLFYIEVRVLETVLFMVAVAIFPEGLYPNVT